MKIYHYILSGKVQGVGFRNYAKEQAFLFKINGWVRNLADGRLELLVKAEEAQLQQFMDALKKGPSPFARVGAVEEHERNIEWEVSGFEIHPNGEREWDDY